MKKKNLDKLYKGRKLQLSEGKRPLTRTEIARVLSRLTMKHIELLSRGQPNEIKGVCEKHDGMYIGHGVCVASKYLNYKSSVDGCAQCKSQEIVDQLNYIFSHAFDEKYIAKWR